MGGFFFALTLATTPRKLMASARRLSAARTFSSRLIRTQCANSTTLEAKDSLDAPHFTDHAAGGDRDRRCFATAGRRRDVVVQQSAPQAAQEQIRFRSDR